MREQIKRELDEVEALLDAAAEPRLHKPPVREARPDVSPETEVLSEGSQAWSELADYEAVRDQYHMDFRRPQTELAQLTALPLDPARDSVGHAHSQAGAGVYTVDFDLVFARTATVVRSPRKIGPPPQYSFSVPAVVHLAYYALRNGYTGGARSSSYIFSPPFVIIAFHASGAFSSARSIFSSHLDIPTLAIEPGSAVRRDSFAHKYNGDVG